MHFFVVRDIQHYVLYLLPAFIGLLVFASGLAYSHFRKAREPGKPDMYHAYPDDITDEQGPFPLVLILVIGGTVLWGFFYILFHGLLEVRI